jgi:hypothetical protein
MRTKQSGGGGTGVSTTNLMSGATRSHHMLAFRPLDVNVNGNGASWLLAR